MASATIGTGGQIFTPVESPIYDPQFRLHTFCISFPKSWYLMGASLSAGLSLKWLRENIFGGEDFQSFDLAAEAIPAGSEGLIFLPYLVGERTPHMDPNAKAMFFGLTLKHTKAHMIRSVMEGVVFSLKESLDIMNQNGIQISRIIASGGGAKSKLWKQMQADIFNADIYTTQVKEQACTGAIITAGVAAKIYATPQEAVDQLVEFSPEVVHPNPENVAIYQDIFTTYKNIYQSNKHLFKAN
jgi:xylulokinase